MAGLTDNPEIQKEKEKGSPGSIRWCFYCPRWFCSGWRQTDRIPLHDCKDRNCLCHPTYLVFTRWHLEKGAESTEETESESKKGWGR